MNATTLGPNDQMAPYPNGVPSNSMTQLFQGKSAPGLIPRVAAKLGNPGL